MLFLTLLIYFIKNRDFCTFPKNDSCTFHFRQFLEYCHSNLDMYKVEMYILEIYERATCHGRVAIFFGTTFWKGPENAEVHFLEGSAEVLFLEWV